MHEALASPEQKPEPPMAETQVQVAPDALPTAQGETARESYTPDYIAMLLVNTFRFSQGVVGTQKIIIHYLAEKFGARFESEAIKEAVPIAGKTIHAIVNNPAVHPRTSPGARGQRVPIAVNEETAQVEATTYADELITSLTGKGSCPVETIVDGIITRDFKRLRLNQPSEPNGRTRKGTHGKSPFSDPNFSQWVYFGLMDQTTGIPEYDQMFADMVKIFERPGPNKFGARVSLHVKEESAKLIEFYLEHHPKQIDLLPERYRPEAEEAIPA